MTGKTRHSENRGTSPRRPRWLLVLTALLALFQAGTAWRALQVPVELASQVSLVLPVEFAAGMFWTGLFALAVFLLVKNRAYALRYTNWVYLGFVIYGAARLVIFVQADYDRRRLPFALMLAIFISIIPVLFLIRSRRVRSEAREIR